MEAVHAGVATPRYNGKVGDLITPETESEYRREWTLWLEAGQRLQRLIGQVYWEKYLFGVSSHLDQDIAANRAWLSAVWTTRNIQPMPEETLQTWVQEIRNKYEAEPREVKS